MKLIKFTQHGFYSGIEDEEHVAVNGSVKTYVSEKLKCSFNASKSTRQKRTAIVNTICSSLDRYHHFRDRIFSGIGDVEFEIISEKLRIINENTEL